MPIPVHALAHRPLPPEAVAELIALPTAQRAPDGVDTFDAVEAEMRQRGWSWQHELVTDSYRTGYGHLLYTEGESPFGDPEARHFLVFGELYPVDPDEDEGEDSMANGRWLYDFMDSWQQLPGWTGRRPATDQDCETVLAQAAQAVTDHLGRAPERTVLSAESLAMGPALTHRVWRTDTHALVLGPAPDNLPYGYLTHLRLSCTPLSCGPELPPAGDEEGLTEWISAHVDW